MGDTIDDSVDPCIDPNDPMNSCEYASKDESSGGQQETEGVGTSTPENVVPENMATEGGVSQADMCDNSIDDDNDGAADSLDPEGCISGENGATGGEASTSEEVVPTESKGASDGATTDGGVPQAENCINFVELECGAGATDGGATTSVEGGLQPEYQKILDKLQQLASVAYQANPNFADAVRAFSNELELQLKARPDPSSPIPPSPLAITVEALKLWVDDTGNIWGTSDSTTDFNPTAECYATVAGDDSKCNIYVAEVIYRATGVTHQAHEEIVSRPECLYVTADGCYDVPHSTGKYFPFRAAEWADTSKYISNFGVDNANPRMGDVWASITEANIIFRDVAHAGIYLGEYNGIKLYISARSNGDGVYGLNSVQHENGIQIKELIDPGEREPKGGVYREYTP